MLSPCTAALLCCPHGMLYTLCEFKLYATLPRASNPTCSPPFATHPTCSSPWMRPVSRCLFPVSYPACQRPHVQVTTRAAAVPRDSPIPLDQVYISGGSVLAWYFDPSILDEVSPVRLATGYAFTTSFGSLCASSFLLTVLDVIRRQIESARQNADSAVSVVILTLL